MSRQHFILDGQAVVPADLMTWANWLENAGQSRVVAKTKVGETEVSTVFLGLDHQYGDGPPLIFESMCFGGDRDGEQERYSTWDEAVAGHATMVALVRATA